MKFSADNSGQILGVSHHDGRIRSIMLYDGERIDLHIIGSKGVEAKVLLSGVRYFVLNNFREDNIIDRMYLWELSNAPDTIMKRMLQAMSIVSAGVLLKKFGDAVQVFHLECSYGAELFAVIGRMQIDGL